PSHQAVLPRNRDLIGPWFCGSGMFNQMGHTHRADLEQGELPAQGFHLGLEVIAFLNNSNPRGDMFGPFLPIGIGVRAMSHSSSGVR
ncbi:MAG: hypothetical protein WBA92_09685, partial [Pseudorhodobacter sp.]